MRVLVGEDGIWDLPLKKLQGERNNKEGGFWVSREQSGTFAGLGEGTVCGGG